MSALKGNQSRSNSRIVHAEENLRLGPFHVEKQAIDGRQVMLLKQGLDCDGWNFQLTDAAHTMPQKMLSIQAGNSTAIL